MARSSHALRAVDAPGVTLGSEVLPGPVVAGQPVPLARFLTDCAASLLPGAPTDPDLVAARDRFVAGGLAALGAPDDEPPWVQRGIDLPDDPVRRRALYRAVGAYVREALGDGSAQNAFFLHKPPGLRLRLQRADDGAPAAGRTAGPGRRRDDVLGTPLDGTLDAAVARWRDAGLVTTVVPGVYEPERTLFGGPRSMEHVHALSTVDSLLWLDRHAGGPADEPPTSPAWLVSLAVLDTLLTGLGVTGWEDLDVWAHVRDRAGRRLPDDPATRAELAASQDAVRDVWARRELIPLLLDGPARTAVEAYGAAVLEGARRWSAGYFTQPGAQVGPRAAAAMYVVFHWNRGGLTPSEQALVAESLGRRAGDAPDDAPDDDRQATP